MVNVIAFKNKFERFLGYAVRTADYLGQMSDLNYVKKLPELFSEFQESDIYRKILLEARIFKNYQELVIKTHAFWNHTIKRPGKDCLVAYRYLAHPYPHGTNPYLVQITKNIAKICCIAT